MAEFRTFDLGQTLALAENIKGMRRQAETDRLRDLYLGVQTEAARGQEQRAQQDQQFQIDEREAKRHYLLADNIERSANPLEFIQQFAPEFIDNYDKKFGPGSFAKLPPDQIKSQASGMKQHFASVAGIALGGSPEDRFKVETAKQAADTAWERQQQLEKMQHGYRMSEIDAQGRYAQDRAASGNERKTFRDIQALRKEFEGMDAVKNYRAVQPIINSARNAPDTGYGDMDLIYAVGKILDPNSVVREGELALTIAAGSPLQRILGTTRFSLEKGGRLTPESRQQLLQMLDGRVGALREQYESEAQRYATYAQENGWNPSQVTGQQQGPAQPSQPGQTIDWSQLR